MPKKKLSPSAKSPSRNPKTKQFLAQWSAAFDFYIDCPINEKIYILNRCKSILIYQKDLSPSLKRYWETVVKCMEMAVDKEASK